MTKKQDSHLDNNEPSLLQTILAYTILLSSVLCLAVVYKNWPETEHPVSSDEALDEPETLWSYMKIPRTVGDAKRIGSLILRYKDDHYYLVFSAYFATYILLQSLCIPGSIVLSILAGYLFPSLLALLIICTCSTLGASTFYTIIYRHKNSLLYLLSGGGNKRVEEFNEYVQGKIQQYHSNIFLCVFVLRATPIFPNWTINLCSPIINIPFKPFVLGTFVGVAPLSVIHVWTGRILNDLSNDQSLVNWQSVLITSLMAVAVLTLVYIKKKS